MKLIALLLFALSSPAAPPAEEISIPLNGGTLLLQDVQFIRKNEWGTLIPEISFQVVNHTTSGWKSVQLQFEIDGVCDGQPRHWSRLVMTTGITWLSEKPTVKDCKDSIIPLFGMVDGCHATDIKASLVLAENHDWRIDGRTGERIDLEKLRQEAEAKRKAEEQAQAEEKVRKAEEKARKAEQDAIEAARQKRLAVERKKKQAAEEALAAVERRKRQDAEEARAAKERAELRAACRLIYARTIDRKVSDLTVRETEQVSSCQALRMYRPD